VIKGKRAGKKTKRHVVRAERPLPPREWVIEFMEPAYERSMFPSLKASAHPNDSDELGVYSDGSSASHWVASVVRGRRSLVESGSEFDIASAMRQAELAYKSAVRRMGPAKAVEA